MESILNSVKKMIGTGDGCEYFDHDIITHINSVFMDLTQRLGVGPSEGFAIADENDVWSDFLPDTSHAKLEGVKSYMALRVRLLFDPPSSSAHLSSYERQIDKMEWVLTTIADSISKESEEIQNG